MMRSGGQIGSGVLDRLASALAHRGPDGQGRYENEERSLGLISTRLAIIDLETGNQPFTAPSGCVLVANGEIYNDPQIRRDIAGAPYASRSDCESPLHLYCQKGRGFADALRGMYAIAVYDKAKARLVLTRDPYGIKPLYYVLHSRYFAFASEAQALISAGLAQNEVRPLQRSELLQLKFTTGVETIFAGINRVLPGETLVVQDGEIVERTRQHAFSKDPPLERRGGDPLAQVDDALDSSVAAHLRSDVPYGLFLSGGIDSPALLALMARHSSQPVVAFTATFPGSRAADEGDAAQRIARAAGAQHHVVEITKEDFANLAPRVAAALDDPTADAAALPTFLLAQLARANGIKVILSGEGGDEIFGGYARYRRAAWLGGLFSRPSRTRGVFDNMVAKNGPHPFRGWRDGLRRCESEVVAPHWSAVQRLQAVDGSEWLPNDLLLKLDRCLMAHGVEGRTPFLDRIVGPFGFNLPNNLKVRGRFGKWLLRQWLAQRLPCADAFARKKVGFNPPMGEWIGHYRADLLKLVSAQPGIAELSCGDVVRRVLTDPTANSQAAWSLLFYALWHSHHVLGIPADGSIGDVLAAAAKLS